MAFRVVRRLNQRQDAAAKVEAASRRFASVFAPISLFFHKLLGSETRRVGDSKLEFPSRILHGPLNLRNLRNLRKISFCLPSGGMNPAVEVGRRFQNCPQITQIAQIFPDVFFPAIPHVATSVAGRCLSLVSREPLNLLAVKQNPREIGAVTVAVAEID